MADTQLATIGDVVRSAQETITDRIRAEFVSLIQPDVFSAMVKTEINRFTTDTSGYGYSNDRAPSPLRLMIRRELEARFLKMVQEEVSKPEYWGGEGPWDDRPGEAVKTIVRQLLPDIVEATFGNAMQRIISSIKGASHQ